MYSDLKENEKRVLEFLIEWKEQVNKSKHVKREEFFFMRRVVADKLDIGVSTVSAIIRSLRKKGYLVVVQAPYKRTRNNWYKLNIK